MNLFFIKTFTNGMGTMDCMPTLITGLEGLRKLKVDSFQLFDQPFISVAVGLPETFSNCSYVLLVLIKE
ncbi:hypothetical protein BSG1_21120 [Bacillus sp. SG-1]|nr:hypothetical protein BSG1_21120 [Bacillus sp. SG-1]